MDEDSYGIRKRIEFLSSVIKDLRPARVLDIGCGTGSYVLFPLAKRFPEVHFLGVDKDRPSINFARNNNNLVNLTFAYLRDLDRQDKFELIIASEVIEHVEQPEEFLLSLKERLKDGGNIFLTLPNGYGPFEIVSFIESLMYLSGLYNVLKKVKQLLFGRLKHSTAEKRDTLAVSPHINFFSYNQICRLIGKAGLKVLKYSPRTFLCGFALDRLLRSQRLLTWNTKVTDFLPPHFSSDWMFLLGKGELKNVKSYKRGLYGSIRKHLNEKRWGAIR